jgi:formate dehydrogenase iron-sulfur subunit
MKAMLIDATRCIGCRACQVACKEWNELPAEKTEFFAAKGYQNPRDLSSSTYTLITYNEVQTSNGHFDWVFGKKQCFHCNEPACATACPVHALEKTEEGPVIYHPELCLGCRYCQLACPFLIPRFQWDKAIPEIRKCTMCADRVAAGEEPACSKVCSTDAIVFGEREDLVMEAEDRIQRDPRGYIHHIYGKDEVGGTCVMHLSNVPFEDLGFNTELTKESLGKKSELAMKPVPFVLAGLGLTLGAVSWIVNRRIENQGTHKTEDRS